MMRIHTYRILILLLGLSLMQQVFAQNDPIEKRILFLLDGLSLYASNSTVCQVSQACSNGHVYHNTFS